MSSVLIGTGTRIGISTGTSTILIRHVMYAIHWPPLICAHRALLGSLDIVSHYSLIIMLWMIVYFMSHTQGVHQSLAQQKYMEILMQCAAFGFTFFPVEVHQSLTVLESIFELRYTYPSFPHFSILVCDTWSEVSQGVVAGSWCKGCGFVQTWGDQTCHVLHLWNVNTYTVYQ